MRSHQLAILLFGFLLTTVSCSAQKKLDSVNLETSKHSLHFEKSPYGLIFTTIEINGTSITAMIDFGDPNILQLSSTFVAENNIEVAESEGTAMMDLKGNKFTVNTGLIEAVVIGNNVEKNIAFSSSPNEMEAVSKQIGTEFHGVVGWGYFKKYHTTLEYSKSKFTLKREAPEIANPVAVVAINENQSYLVIPIQIEDKSVNALIDTGSPVSILDNTLEFSGEVASFKIGSGLIAEKLLQEDLSVLKDLNVQVILGGTFLANYTLYINPIANTISLEKRENR